MFKFQGYDWQELAICWGLISERTWGKTETLIDEEVVAKQIRDYLHAAMEDEEKARGCARDIKQYLRAMLVCNADYCAPVWLGMLAIENDNTLLRVTDCLLQLMWT